MIGEGCLKTKIKWGVGDPVIPAFWSVVGDACNPSILETEVGILKY